MSKNLNSDPLSSFYWSSLEQSQQIGFSTHEPHWLRRSDDYLLCRLRLYLSYSNPVVYANSSVVSQATVYSDYTPTPILRISRPDYGGNGILTDDLDDVSTLQTEFFHYFGINSSDTPTYIPIIRFRNPQSCLSSFNLFRHISNHLTTIIIIYLIPNIFTFLLSDFPDYFFTNNDLFNQTSPPQAFKRSFDSHIR